MKLTTQFLLFCGLMQSAFFSIAQVEFTASNTVIDPVFGNSVNCAVDMNGDFLDDIVRVDFTGIHIDYQQPDGTFIHEYYEMNVQNYPDWSICAADYDNNGYNDLLFGNGSYVSFVKANETGSDYSEIPFPEYIFSQRSTFADIDNDGNLDAFVCHDVDQSHPYRNDGNGNMILDQQLIETMDAHGNYAALWVDYDNDEDTDLYITKCVLGSSPGDPERTNLMYRNNGDGTYTEVAEAIGLADNAQSWATVFEDFDNDGDFDAFIVNHDFANRFFINDGMGNFTDVIQNTNIESSDLGAWENAAADFDNDGFVDIFSELNNEIYFNNGDLTFTGSDQLFGKGGIGDFNNDGFLDIVSGDAIWYNDGNANNYLKINTIGTISNRNGIGARIEIIGSWGKQIREVRSGESFSPMSSLTTHFGLGTADKIEMLIVKWPSGTVNMIENPPINTTLNIIEGETSCFGAPFEIAVDGNLSICENETVELTAPEDAEAYNWSSGQETQSITVSESGSYNVYITDADGCIAFSNNIIVNVVTEEAVSITVDGELLFCEGESVTLSTDQANSYLWSNGSETPSIEVFEAGDYSVEVPGLCVDKVNSNVISVEVLANNPPEIVDISFQNDNTALIEATGTNLEWFDSESSTTPVGTGNVFTTPIINQTTTFYVESTTQYGGEEETGGKPDNSGSGGAPSSGAYSLFNVWEAFTLSTVKVYVPAIAGNGIRTVNLTDENGTVIASKSFDLTVGEHILELDFEVPVGNGMSLRCPENTLFRNNNGVSYPYDIGSVGTIYSSLFGPQYYYYFYDWQIKKEGWYCLSDRLPVTVSVNSTKDLHLFNDYQLFPNPTDNHLHLNYNLKSTQDISIHIYNQIGQEVLVQKHQASANQLQQAQFSLAEFPNGFYTLKMNLEEGQLVERIVVQR